MAIVGNELSALEWRDQLDLCYVMEPGDLTQLCDGCDILFSFDQALYCKKYGLITIRHDKIVNDFLDLASIGYLP